MSSFNWPFSPQKITKFRKILQKFRKILQVPHNSTILPEFRKFYKNPVQFHNLTIPQILQKSRKFLQFYKNSANFTKIPQNFELKLGTRNKCGGNKFLCTCSSLFHSAAYQLDQKIAFFETPPPPKKKKNQIKSTRSCCFVPTNLHQQIEEHFFVLGKYRVTPVVTWPLIGPLNSSTTLILS